MTGDELVELVGQMRTAQRTYFKTRTLAALEESKRLEKAVDLALASCQGQASLFDAKPLARTPEEVRDAVQTMGEYLRTTGGRRLSRDSAIQCVGMTTALSWVTGEEVVDIPGYVNPLPAMVAQMKAVLLQTKDSPPAQPLHTHDLGGEG